MSVEEEEEATRAALVRYAEHGSDLSKPMTIDFFVAVPNDDAGRAVARAAVALGFEVSVERDQMTMEWTCYCKKSLIPTFEAVIAIERQLDALAKPHGGYADGFGSFGNAAP